MLDLGKYLGFFIWTVGIGGHRCKELGNVYSSTCISLPRKLNYLEKPVIYQSPQVMCLAFTTFAFASWTNDADQEKNSKSPSYVVKPRLPRICE